MPKINERRRMQEYVASRLEDNGDTIISLNGAINCILLKEKGLVYLVDREFPDQEFRKRYLQALQISPNVSTVFYKDGKTYFRNAAQGITGKLKGERYKQKNDLSLKNYSDEELYRMIKIRPEEKFIISNNSGRIQYYQPESERLSERIIEYVFKPVVFDYSHIPPSQRFGPIEQESERLKIWTAKKELLGKLDLNGKYLIPN